MKSISHWPVYFLLIISVQFLALTVCGQVRRDTASINLRKFDNVELTKFQNDDAFKYRFVAEPPASLWERFWAWVWFKINRILSTRSGRVTMRVVVYTAAFLLIALFIFQLIKMNASGLFGAARAGKINYSVSDDDINSIDFESELSLAIEAGNYRLAIRLYYLSTLKSLSDRSLIDWQIDKTNISYVRELQANTLKEEFRHLTASFDNHWYGNIAVSREEFALVREKFETFNRDLKA